MAFGVFFVAIIDTFDTSASVTSLIMGVQNAVFCVSALLVHNVLLELVSVRTSAMLGGLLMASGMMLGMFAYSLPFLILGLSVLVDETVTVSEENVTASTGGKLKDFCSLVFDVKLLRNPLFWLVQAYVCVGVMGATGAGSYMPSMCREKGLDKDDTAIVLTTWGACNLVGRLASGVVADRKWLRPSHISALSFVAIAVLFHTLRLLPHNFTAVMAFGVLYGMFEGTYFTMLPLIIIDFVSLDNFSRTFGFAQLSQGAFATVLYPVLGRLRDVTGNYHATFHLLGACSDMATVLLLLEPVIRALKWAKPRDILELSSERR
nr:hypothetical protein BaRGS_007375 [Batillaria attramentaria]